MSLIRMPGYQERLRKENVALLEERLVTIQQDIHNSVRDYYRVLKYLKALKEQDHQ